MNNNNNNIIIIITIIIIIKIIRNNNNNNINTNIYTCFFCCRGSGVWGDDGRKGGRGVCERDGIVREG